MFKSFGFFCAVALLVTTTAHANDSKIFLSLLVENARIDVDFEARCAELGARLDQRLLAIAPESSLSATTRARGNNPIECALLGKELDCISEIARFCDADVISPDFKYHFREVRSEEVPITHGQKTEEACGRTLRETDNRSNTLQARIVKNGLFKKNCRVDSIAVELSE